MTMAEEGYDTEDPEAPAPSRHLSGPQKAAIFLLQMGRIQHDQTRQFTRG